MFPPLITCLRLEIKGLYSNYDHLYSYWEFMGCFVFFCLGPIQNLYVSISSQEQWDNSAFLCKILVLHIYHTCFLKVMWVIHNEHIGSILGQGGTRATIHGRSITFLKKSEDMNQGLTWREEYFWRVQISFCCQIRMIYVVIEMSRNKQKKVFIKKQRLWTI